MQKKQMIRYDWTNLRAEVVGSGHGLTAADLQAHRDQARAAVEKFTARCARGEVGFPDLPFDKQALAQVEAYARAQRGKYRWVLLLGIGGSALGPYALDAACNGPRPFRKKKVTAELVVLDNVDPLILGRTLEQLDPRQTLVLVITKSGSTAETIAQFLIVYNWLRKRLGAKKAAQQVAAVTDPQKGDLLDIARREGFEVFAVPPQRRRALFCAHSGGLAACGAGGRERKAASGGRRLHRGGLPSAGVRLEPRPCERSPSVPARHPLRQDHPGHLLLFERPLGVGLLVSPALGRESGQAPGPAKAGGFLWPDPRGGSGRHRPALAITALYGRAARQSDYLLGG